MTTTYERLTTVTTAQVQARLLAADTRVRAACSDMTERLFRRGPAPVCPSDCETPAPPAIPIPPDAIAAVHTMSHCWSARAPSDEYTSSIHRDGLLSPRDDVKSGSTPSMLVDAIRAADAYAADIEGLARQYAADTAAAIEAHASAQADACRELAGLCAQV